MMKTAVIDIQYANDYAILTDSAEELQTSLDLFAEAYQSLTNAGPLEIKIYGGILVEVVEHFPYLGSHLSQKATIEAEIQHRIFCCASTSFRKLRHRVIDDDNLMKETTVMVYKAVCITTLLYGSEAWVTYRCHLKTLDRDIPPTLPKEDASHPVGRSSHQCQRPH